MNIYKTSIVLIFAVLLTVSCSTRKNQQKSVINKNQEMTVLLEPTVDNSFTIPKGKPDYTINNAEIKDSVLVLNISYSGGCKEHNFELMFNGMYMKSLPRKASLYLKHESNGDICKKLVLLELRYNLSSILGEAKQAANFNLYSYSNVLKYNNDKQ